jgi:methionyl-tRNA formyltransferase
VPTFEALLASDHEVPLLVTRPVANSGNRRKSADNPTRDAGIEAAIEMFEPNSINDEAAIERLREAEADLFVVCDYGQILSKACLGASRWGGINLHGSLLPRYRGAAPINWAIYHGETNLGVTVIQMSTRLDAGNSLTADSLALGNDETAEDVEPRLARLGVQPVMKALELFESWDGSSALGTPQDKSLVTLAPRLNKKDGLIDWTRPAADLRNQIRAFQPWPGSFTNWTTPKKGPLRMIIHRVSIVDVSGTPGQVASCDSTSLVIYTGDQGLSIDRLQPAGKRSMPIADFLRGYQPQLGDVLS